jgi:sugar phosphate isomerase/epimerase
MMTSNTSRRRFIKTGMLNIGAASLAGITLAACGSENQTELVESPSETDELFFKISLAQWSLHRSLEDKRITAEEFPAVARERFDIAAVEYVNQFYVDHVTDESFWTSLNQRAKDNGIRNLLLMIDNEGDLGNTNDAERRQAVENHHKWVDAAHTLECHSVRVNGFGDGSREAVGAALADGLGSLAEYAGKAGIDVVIENHGLYSADAQWVLDVIRRTGRENCGTLPDFGNWCITNKWGSTQDGTCPEVYDRYQGVQEMMSVARGVSAKSYRFDETGQETTIDYGRMLRIVKDAGFTGHIGIEWEGSDVDEPAGIIATRDLLVAEGRKLAG